MALEQDYKEQGKRRGRQQHRRCRVLHLTSGAHQPIQGISAANRGDDCHHVNASFSSVEDDAKQISRCYPLQASAKSC